MSNEKLAKKVRKVSKKMSTELTTKAFMECHKLPLKIRLKFAWKIIMGNPKWNM